MFLVLHLLYLLIWVLFPVKVCCILALFLFIVLPLCLVTIFMRFLLVLCLVCTVSSLDSLVSSCCIYELFSPFLNTLCRNCLDLPTVLCHVCFRSCQRFNFDYEAGKYFYTALYIPQVLNIAHILITYHREDFNSEKL